MGQAGRRVRWRALVAVGAAGAVVLAGLAGCDGNDPPTPKPLKPSSASPSPTEPTGSPAPTRPPAAAGTTEASAKAFARYFVSTINHALITGDTSGLDNASSSRCKGCRQISGTLQELYDGGGRIESVGWKVQDVRPVVDDTERKILLVGITFPAELVIRTGQSNIRRGGSEGALTLFLVKSPDGWITNRLDLTQ